VLKGGLRKTQQTSHHYARQVSHRVICDARAIRLFDLLLAFQTGQSLLRQTNANLTLLELRAVTFVRLIKYDLGLDGS